MPMHMTTPTVEFPTAECCMGKHEACSGLDRWGMLCSCVCHKKRLEELATGGETP